MWCLLDNTTQHTFRRGRAMACRPVPSPCVIRFCKTGAGFGVFLLQISSLKRLAKTHKCKGVLAQSGVRRCVNPRQSQEQQLLRSLLTFQQDLSEMKWISLHDWIVWNPAASQALGFGS